MDIIFYKIVDIGAKIDGDSIYFRFPLLLLPRPPPPTNNKYHSVWQLGASPAKILATIDLFWIGSKKCPLTFFFAHVSKFYFNFSQLYAPTLILYKLNDTFFPLQIYVWNFWFTSDFPANFSKAAIIKASIKQYFVVVVGSCRKKLATIRTI